MQTPKSRPGSLDVPQKASATTPRTVRKFKPDSDSVSVSSPNLVNKTPKNGSPKVFDRQSPRSSPAEKKRVNRVSELELQLSQLQDELKKVKDQLSSSESWKKKAQQEAEDSKKQLVAMSAKLEETLKELNDISYSEEARIQELRKVSQDRDKAWESELDAVQKQHSMDSAALASSLNEIQRLKIELNRVSESEASQARYVESTRAEIQSLRIELRETLEWVDFLKKELNESRESESQSIEEVSKLQTELEVLKSTEETLRSERGNAVESYKSLVMELDHSKDRVNTLEELVKNLQADPIKNIKNSDDDLKNEVIRLRDALESAEKRYHDEYIQSTLQIRNAYELVERAKAESLQIEAELEAKVKESMAEVEELKNKLSEKENIKVETELEPDQKNSESVLQDLKAMLAEKEAQLENISEDNEKLKSEIKKTEIQRAEADKRLDCLTEEADKCSRNADRISEQLDSAQTANSEIEAELKRVKVQADQWRKAAEAAASMLTTGNNDSYHTIGGKLDLPYPEDMDDDSLKKKNGNMLRKIGVLLKKGQK